MTLTLGQIADWIHAEGNFDLMAEATGYSIDSRSLSAGDLFFAVKGEVFDGHQFVETALRAGAVAAVVSTGWVVPAEVEETRLLRVPDGEDCVLAAMQKLARAVRLAWGKRVIGVTGSAGKTTTKEMVAQVLGARFHVLKSAGNLNNAFGVPLQLLRLQPEHEMAVIEMGMNHAGEIHALTQIALPDWGIVSNVAPVHLEHFAEGIAGIARAKKELIDALPQDGIAFLNMDDPYVSRFAEGHTATFFGLSARADVRASNVTSLGADGMQFVVHAKGDSIAARTALMGEHNVYNALAGIAVGLACGISLQECVTAAATLLPSEKRGAVVAWNGAQLVNDCYNSNPRALQAMMDALMAMRGKRHIVVAGEMLELGSDAALLHFQCGTYAAKRGVDLVLGVRGEAKELVQGASAQGVEAIFVETPEEAGIWLREHVREGDVVLLKASRGVRLERALDLLPSIST